MTLQADPPADATSAPAPRDDGDVSIHLEELLSGSLDWLPAAVDGGEGGDVDVELVGPHLRVSGTFGLGRFRRVSDFINSQTGLIGLRNATVLRRNGDATRVTSPHIWVSPAEVTIIGQTEGPEAVAVPPEFRIPKEPRPLIVVTPGHTLTGDIYIPVGGSLSVFIESQDPAFIPMTDLRARSLADRRIITRYPFAMLNRRHIVAATEIPEGMAAGSRVV
jgi:hypothetical protein